MCLQLVNKKCPQHINQKDANEPELMGFFQDRKLLLVKELLETDDEKEDLV